MSILLMLAMVAPPSARHGSLPCAPRCRPRTLSRSAAAADANDMDIDIDIDIDMAIVADPHPARWSGCRAAADPVAVGRAAARRPGAALSDANPSIVAVTLLIVEGG